MSAYLHILRLKSKNLYIGATLDLEQRTQEHFEGSACSTIKIDPPLELIHFERNENLKDARRREDQLKRWTRAKKEAFVSGDFETLRMLAKSRAEK